VPEDSIWNAVFAHLERMGFARARPGDFRRLDVRDFRLLQFMKHQKRSPDSERKRK